jgi:hypothetical protein
MLAEFGNYIGPELDEEDDDEEDEDIGDKVTRQGWPSLKW